jgi:hypothetical protein
MLSAESLNQPTELSFAEGLYAGQVIGLRFMIKDRSLFGHKSPF